MKKMTRKIDKFSNSYNNSLSVHSMIKILEKDGFEVKVKNKQDIIPTHLRHFSEIDKNCLSFYTEKDSKFLNSKDRHLSSLSHSFLHSVKLELSLTVSFLPEQN